MSNIDLKFYRSLKEKKFRDKSRLFLIEGVHLIEECIDSRYYSKNIEKIFVRKDFNNGKLMKKINNSIPDVDIMNLDEKLFNSLSETVNSQGIIAAVSNSTIINESGSSDNTIVALDGISDPGNAGTILRTAYWFGINKVIFNSDSVDVFNSKVIRSSQGALFNLNIESGINLKNELEKYFDNGYKIFLTDLNTEHDIKDVKFNSNEKNIIVLGNEAGGISEEILENKNYNKVKIKGYSGSESLNVAVAAGIILYEIVNSK